MSNVLAERPLFAGWLPRRLADEMGFRRPLWVGGASAGVHAIALLLLASLMAPVPAKKPVPELTVTTLALTFSLKDLPLVFTPAVRSGGGGGGGGAHEKAPVPKAHGRGDDPITLPATREPVPSSPLTGRELPFQTIDIPVMPLASGTEVIVGLPAGVEGAPPSRGPGSGGGVGDGIGTGAGSGAGSGLGPGTGGGMGGGAYRPGGGVSAPVLVTQVRPSYTADALRDRIQGSVLLEAIIRRDGQADAIRVVRPLDPGLDAQAVRALQQWRFRPGRLGESPVDVLVSVVIDFMIH